MLPVFNRCIKPFQNKDGGVVYQNVDSSKSFGGSVRNLTGVGLPGDIGLQRTRHAAFALDLPGGFFSRLAIHIGHQNLGTFFSKTSAVAWPIPAPAPVTIATLFCNLMLTSACPESFLAQYVARPPEMS